MPNVVTRRGGRLQNPDQQIGDWYQEYTGNRAANPWGQDIDANYAENIRRAIYNSEAAVNYRNSLSRPPQTTADDPGGTVFSDRGAIDWENLVRQGAGRLTSPQSNPDFQPWIDYMRKYFAQLQQPGYTPAQQDLIQTQALDPLERQRTAAKDQTRQRLAARGIANSANGGDGGLIEHALQDIDRQFNELRTKSQSNFATSQIAYDQQRQQQAAQVGQAISQAQQAMATNDEQRMLQAISLMFSIPQYADQRMLNANSVLQPLNSASLLQLLNGLNGQNAQGNAYQNAQNQNLWSNLGLMLSQLF